MKTYRWMAQICSMGILLAANAPAADDSPAFFEGFEDQECQVVCVAGDQQHHKINKAELVTQPVHSGKQSCMVDVTTDAECSLPYLYFSVKALHMPPQPGQKMEGWMKVDAATSEGVAVVLGVSMLYPRKTETGVTPSAQHPMVVVEQGADGWQRFQSEDLLDFYTNLAKEQKWNPDGLFVSGWLLYLAGADLKNKHVVVYIDDLVIK